MHRVLEFTLISRPYRSAVLWWRRSQHKPATRPLDEILYSPSVSLCQRFIQQNSVIETKKWWGVLITKGLCPEGALNEGLIHNVQHSFWVKTLELVDLGTLVLNKRRGAIKDSS